MTSFILHALPTQGRSLVPDTDHLLASVRPAQLLLINLLPGEYPFESHDNPEYLVCLRGTLMLEDEHGVQIRAELGEMVEVCPGVRHRFAPQADAVILTVAQSNGV
jgi:quercetin dioxygenase-like cupin family protein